MSKVSEILKKEREAKQLTLEEISNQTKININFLKYIENGEFEKLPSYAHTFGFIKSYASFLGLNLTEIENKLKEEYSRDNFRQGSNEQPKEESSNTNNKKRTNFKYFSLFVLFLLLIFFISIYITQKNKKEVIKEVITESKNETVVLKNNKSEEISKPSTDNRTVLNSNIKAVTLDNKTKSDNEAAKVNPEVIVKKILKKEENQSKPIIRKVSLYFNDICWIHLKADNKTDYDFIAEKNMVKTLPFSKFFKLDIGNAAAITIKYKKQKFTRLGKFRQPVKNLYFYINDNDTLELKK